MNSFLILARASGNVIGGSLWLAPQSRSFTSSDSPDRRSHHLSEQGIPFPVPSLIVPFPIGLEALVFPKALCSVELLPNGSG